MDENKDNLNIKKEGLDEEVRILRERLAKMEEIFKRSQVQVVTSKLLDVVIASFIRAAEESSEGAKGIYDKAVGFTGEHWSSQSSFMSLIGKKESIIDSLNDYMLTIARDRLTKDTECTAYLSDQNIKLKIKHCPFLEVERILMKTNGGINCCFPGCLGACMIKQLFSLPSFDYKIVKVDENETCEIILK